MYLCTKNYQIETMKKLILIMLAVAMSCTMSA